MFYFLVEIIFQCLLAATTITILYLSHHNRAKVQSLNTLVSEPTQSPPRQSQVQTNRQSSLVRKNSYQPSIRMMYAGDEGDVVEERKTQRVRAEDFIGSSQYFMTQQKQRQKTKRTTIQRGSSQDKIEKEEVLKTQPTLSVIPEVLQTDRHIKDFFQEFPKPRISKKRLLTLFIIFRVSLIQGIILFLSIVNINQYLTVGISLLVAFYSRLLEKITYGKLLIIIDLLIHTLAIVCVSYFAIGSNELITLGITIGLEITIEIVYRIK